MRIAAIPLASIRRPLQRVLDESKVADLMESIAAEGQKEPIDVLELDGQLWGFNGCHRVAAHERLGMATMTQASSWIGSLTPSISASRPIGPAGGG